MKKGFFNKKAVTHTEMIVSFAIFIIFLIFLFIYLPPIQRPDISDVLLDSLHASIENDAVISLLEIPVIINSSSYTGTGEACFNFINPLNASNPDFVLVNNNKSEATAFNITTNYIFVNNSGPIYYIFYSNETNFSANGLNKAGQVSGFCIVPQYNFSTPRIYSLFSYDALKNLTDKEISSYNELKTSYNLTAADFMIGVRNSTNQVILPSAKIKEPPVGIPVRARDIPIEYLQEGVIKKGILNIRIW